MRDNQDDRERDDAAEDGMHPDRDASPDESEASPTRCENRPGERDGGTEESEFEMSDELHEQFPVEQIPIGTDPMDGMPVPMTGDPQDALAIPFTYETQLCIEDDRQFVEMFEGEFFRPDQMVQKTEAQVRLRYEDDGAARERLVFQPSEVIERWGKQFVMSAGMKLIPVRPFRERCIHYKRQVFSNDNQPDMSKPGHQLVFRVCAARKSNGGACMSLRDEGVYQCDFRDPPDERTTRVQDAKDRHKLVERPDLVLLPLFHMPGDTVQLERKPS